MLVPVPKHKEFSILTRIKGNTVRAECERVRVEKGGTVKYGADLKSSSLFFFSRFVKSLGGMHWCKCNHPGKDPCWGRFFCVK